MSRVGIITIIDNYNYGNRLQNYAVHKILDNLNIKNETILNYNYGENNLKNKIKKRINYFSPKLHHRKYYNFIKFNKNIKFYKKIIDKNDTDYSKVNLYFDTFIVGSDQVWNPNFKRFNKLDLLEFTDNKKISFSASFGVSDISEFVNDNVISSLNKFDYISVREQSGKKIINDLLPEKNVDVLIDPTLVLTEEEWLKVAKKPKKYNGKKFVFSFFLGNKTETVDNAIKKYAKDNNCEIVNVFDINDPYYTSGPAEFLWLEKNAEMIFTDSFHSSVFAFIFNKPFVVFDRVDNFKNMSTRLDNLLSTFNLKNRKFDGESIKEININHDYSESYNILKNEQKKSIEFLLKSLK